MQLLYYSLAFALPALAASSDDSKTPRAPCTIRSPTSGAFFDLNPIHVELPKKASKDARTDSWSARGYDYGANFTLNFCGPVVEDLKDVVGVEENRWQNISAFYEIGGKTYSIGCVPLTLSIILVPSDKPIQPTELRARLPRPKAGSELYRWLALSLNDHRHVRPRQRFSPHIVPRHP